MVKLHKCEMCGNMVEILMMDDADKYKCMKCSDCRKKYEVK